MSFSSRRRNYMLKRHRRDGLFEFIRDMLSHSFVLSAMEESAGNSWSHFEELINEHRSSPSNSRLAQLVPTIGNFFTPLLLRSAWDEYDAKYGVSKRRFINVSFNEIRHVCNLAQLKAFSKNELQASRESSAAKKLNKAASATDAAAAYVVAQSPPRDSSTAKQPFKLAGPPLEPMTTTKPFLPLKLVTFDGDCTLYSDGAAMKNVDLANALIDLMMHGIYVGLVTAAGYGHDAPRYEARVRLLLNTLETRKDIDAETASRFFVLGGECNYFLHCNLQVDSDGNTAATLAPKMDWSPPGLSSCTEEQMQELLDVAEETLKEAVAEMKMKAVLIRKERAVGIVQRQDAKHRLRREQLDESVLRVQYNLRKLGSNVPFCAFNGGNDVFIDIGNKRVGVQGLQRYLGGGLDPCQCLHIGDQFLNTGNDFAARSCCPTVWVTSPVETMYICRRLLRGLNGTSTTINED